MKIFAALILLAVFMSGCIKAVYHGQSFPATTSITVYRAQEKLPENCQVIGVGSASGEFSVTSDAKLEERLKTLGMQHGAGFMKIIGTRIVASGRIADSSSEDFLTATDDPDQLAGERSMSNYLNTPQSLQSYKRIMYAEFLR